MNAANEPPVVPVDPVVADDPVVPARSESSTGGLAAATLRALRAGNQTEPVSAEPRPAAPSETVLSELAPSETVSLEKPVAATDEVVEAPAADDAMREPVPEVVTDAAPSRPRSSVITTACAILAVAALVFAIVAGVLWRHAGHNNQRTIGIAREQVVDDARLAITTVNTSDYHHPAAALDNWLDASTGSLRSQFSQSRTTAIKLLAEAKMVTKANVLDAAVTNLDLKKGSATVIASVNVTRTPATGAVSTVRNRFRASMTRTGGQWKLSNLAVVPVSLS